MGYNINEYENGVRGQLTSCECDRCGLEFKLTRRLLSTKINEAQRNIYCSKSCSSESQKKQTQVCCSQCNKIFNKTTSKISQTNFCSSECYYSSKRGGSSVSLDDFKAVISISETCKRFMKN